MTTIIAHTRIVADGPLSLYHLVRADGPVLFEDYTLLCHDCLSAERYPTRSEADEGVARHAHAQTGGKWA